MKTILVLVAMLGILTAAQITDLGNGNLYVNLRSNVFPSGEIRGQIIQEIPEHSTLAFAGVGMLVLGYWLRGRRGSTLI